jgi:hypothetical protein
VLKIIGLVVLVLVAVILVVPAFRPDTFRVQRAATMKAPPEKIAANLSDFHAWTAWSPWERMDPAMKRTYAGAPKGKGATYAWESSKVGQGGMAITDVGASRVALDLDFVKPFEAHNKVEFSLTPKGDATDVTWSMSGPVPYFFRLLHLFTDMDGMVGKDFEAGLANLKAVVEK